MVTVRITPHQLWALLGGKFTLPATIAICDYLEEFSDEAVSVNDIPYCFSEVPQSWAHEYAEEDIYRWLENGNLLVFQ